MSPTQSLKPSLLVSVGGDACVRTTVFTFYLCDLILSSTYGCGSLVKTAQR